MGSDIRDIDNVRIFINLKVFCISEGKAVIANAVVNHSCIDPHPAIYPTKLTSKFVVNMGKNKKKRRRQSSSSGTGNDNNLATVDSDPKHTTKRKTKRHHQSNPLYTQQQRFLSSLSKKERTEFFSSDISPERRAELWMEQADLGEALVNRYAWATPSATAIRILKEFSPLVEIGCGSNAYWCRLLKEEHGIDIVGYDLNIETSGGKIVSDRQHKKRMKKQDDSGSNKQESLYIKQGGPSVLEDDETCANRTLFLCYPDEEDDDEEKYNDNGEEEFRISMGAKCLESYQGQYVIHVGELFLDFNLSLDQAPWGRSSAQEFQERLAAEYHCLLKVALPSWIHVRDSISVWKRSERQTMVFAAEDSNDDEDDEEIEYRNIPVEEQLPTNLAAPCLLHLLPKEGDEEEALTKQQTVNTQPNNINQDKLEPGKAVNFLNARDFIKQKTNTTGREDTFQASSRNATKGMEDKELPPKKRRKKKKKSQKQEVMEKAVEDVSQEIDTANERSTHYTTPW